MEGYAPCPWCGAQNRLRDHVLPTSCFRCMLPMVEVSPTPLDDEEDHGTEKKRSPKKTRRMTVRRTPFTFTPTGNPVMGIDPGSRYTGVVVRDADAVLYATTFVRPGDLPGPEWALSVTHQIRDILQEYNWENIPLGIEGVTDPKGFHRGSRAAINPKDIIRAGMVLGAVYVAWNGDVTIVPPGDNGSQHISWYPPDLIGRRPPSLPGVNQGAKTRGHEQSAYDVAGYTIREIRAQRRKKHSGRDSIRPRTSQ